VEAESEEILTFLFDGRYSSTQLNVWRTVRHSDLSISVTFHVEPDLVNTVLTQLAYKRIRFQTLSSDLQRDIDNHMFLNEKAHKAEDPFSYYYTFDELQVFLTEQAALCGTQCSIEQIGTSFEGRPLNIIKMTGEPTAGCTQKPSIWIDAGIHAREWIAVSTGQFLINRLVEEYSNDTFVKQMRDTYDWYILPSVNPDGYVFTWEQNRMWRKTRQTYDGVLCIGADPNRNFDFQWMTVGASSDPCSDTYAGPQPFSEPEAKAVADYISARNNTWDLFITLHSYGQLWMTPWGYTMDLPPNYDSMERVGLAAVDTIAQTSGEVYEFGSASNILYQSSGTSRDWAAGVPIIPYVYTIELRNENTFILPPSEIRPTGEEIWAALKTTISTLQVERPPTCVTPGRI
jgi:murein tripeptide amidase MpaA